MTSDEQRRNDEMARRTYLELVGVGIVASGFGGVGPVPEETGDRRGFGRIRYGDTSFGNPRS